MTELKQEGGGGRLWQIFTEKYLLHTKYIDERRKNERGGLEKKDSISLFMGLYKLRALLLP